MEIQGLWIAGISWLLEKDIGSVDKWIYALRSEHGLEFKRLKVAYNIEVLGKMKDISNLKTEGITFRGERERLLAKMKKLKEKAKPRVGSAQERLK